MYEHFKQVLDGVSISSITASFIGLVTLPNLVYIATLIWTVLRIYEMKTIQRMVSRMRKKPNVHKE